MKFKLHRETSAKHAPISAKTVYRHFAWTLFTYSRGMVLTIFASIYLQPRKVKVLLQFNLHHSRFSSTDSLDSETLVIQE